MSKADDVRKEYERKLREAEKEAALLALVPAGGRVHTYSLYGTAGTVAYGDSYSYDKALNWDTAKQLVRMLPPVSLTLTKDGCTSIKAREYVESIPEDHKDRGKEESYISPVFVNIEPLHGAKVEIEWISRLTSGDLVRVKCHMGYLPPGIGRYDSRRREVMGGVHHDSAHFSATPDMHNVFIGDESVTQLESPIRWASGGPEYANRMTLYFCDLGADLDPASVGAAIVDHLAALAGKK